MSLLLTVLVFWSWLVGGQALKHMNPLRKSFPQPHFSIRQPFLRAKPIAASTINTVSKVVGPSQSVFAAIDKHPEKALSAVDLAVSTGNSMASCHQVLRELVYESCGDIRVSQSGQIVYKFPSDYRYRISRRSFRRKLEIWFDTNAKNLKFLWRKLTVGFVYVLALTLVILVGLASSTSNRKSETKDKNKHHVHHYHHSSYHHYNHYNHYNHYRMFDGLDMLTSWAKSLFSGVEDQMFGSTSNEDSGQSATYRARHNAYLTELIRSNRGVVCAEQLATFVGVKIPSDEGIIDESWVLPLLIHMEGIPVLTKNNSIAYYFRCMAKPDTNEIKLPRLIYENEFDCLNLSFSTIFAWLLGVLIMYLSIILHVGLTTKQLRFQDWLEPYSSTVASGAFYVGLTFGIMYFVLPIIRTLSQFFANRNIRTRNRNREAWYALLLNPKESLSRKLEDCKELSKDTVELDKQVI